MSPVSPKRSCKCRTTGGAGNPVQNYLSRNRYEELAPVGDESDGVEFGVREHGDHDSGIEGESARANYGGSSGSGNQRVVQD